MGIYFRVYAYRNYQYSSIVWSNVELIELTYVSEPAQGMSFLGLMRLLYHSYLRNLRLEITGVLIFENNQFGQVIEGPKDVIESLWEKIQKDDRHKILHQIEFDEIDQRLFPNWALRFYGGDQIARDVPHLSGLLDGLPSYDVELLRIMRSVAKGNQG